MRERGKRERDVVEGLESREKVTLQADLVNDLGLDSLDLVELVYAIEEDFEIVIDDEIAEGWNSVKDIVDWVEGKHG